MEEMNNCLTQLENSDALESLKRMRDQHLAHLDAAPLEKVPLPMEQFDRLVEGIKGLFDGLSLAHDRSIWYWESQSKRSAWETSELLRTLRDHWDEHHVGPVRRYPHGVCK